MIEIAGNCDRCDVACPVLRYGFSNERMGRLMLSIRENEFDKWWEEWVSTRARSLIGVKPWKEPRAEIEHSVDETKAIEFRHNRWPHHSN
jgi:hypothetical protein